MPGHVVIGDESVIADAVMVENVLCVVGGAAGDDPHKDSARPNLPDHVLDERKASCPVRVSAAARPMLCLSKRG